MKVLTLEKLNNLSLERASLYMGEKRLTENTKKVLKDCLNDFFDCLFPKCVYHTIDASDSTFLKGNDIKKHLAGCEKAIWFLITLGSQADTFIRKMKVLSPLKALSSDALASVYVEQLSEKFEQDLKIELSKQGLFTTQSYAPGYGDYPLSVLKDAFLLLNAQKNAGVTLNDSFMITPRKTICAVIGVSNKKVKGFRAGCEHCSQQENCNLKKEGKTCVR